MKLAQILVMFGGLFLAVEGSCAALHPLLEPLRFKADMLDTFSAAKDPAYAKAIPQVRVLSVVRRHFDDKLPDVVAVKAEGILKGPGSVLEGYRTFAFLDNDEHQVIYDSSPFQVECTSPDFKLGDQQLIVLDDKKLLKLQVVTYYHPCCGASEEEEKKSFFFDAQNKFSKLLELEDSHVYFGYADCSNDKVEARKQSMQMTWLRPNGGSEGNFAWIEVRQWTYSGPKWTFKGIKEGTIEWSKDKSKLELKYDRK